MFRKGIAILPVIIALLVISLIVAVGASFLYQKEHAANIKLQDQVLELENLQRSTATKLEESKKSATDLMLKLQDAKSKIDALSAELETVKSEHAATTSQLEQFKADISKQKSLREDLESRLNQVQDEGKQAKEQIKIMQQQKAALEEKIKNLESGPSGVELGKVVVSPEVSSAANNAAGALPKSEVPLAGAVPSKELNSAANLPPANRGIEGKVLVVNKEFNFAVINLGSKDKIKVGDEFAVMHAGNYIGDLKVEKVHEGMSAAGFAVALKDLIKENDSVAQKIK